MIRLLSKTTKKIHRKQVKKNKKIKAILQLNKYRRIKQEKIVQTKEIEKPSKLGKTFKIWSNI